MIIKVGSKKATSLPNATLRDKRLALDELGLLVRLLSRPSGWEIYPGALRKETGWGRDKLRKVLANLEAAGYLRRIRGRYKGDDPKKMGTWQWHSEVYAEAQEYEPGGEETAPCPENPFMVHHARVYRTTVGPAPVEPSYGEHGHIDLKPDLKKEPDLKPPPPPPDQNQGGGGFENSEIKTLKPGIEEINEYIRLGRLFGGKNGLPPSSPPGLGGPRPSSNFGAGGETVKNRFGAGKDLGKEGAEEEKGSGPGPGAGRVRATDRGAGGRRPGRHRKIKKEVRQQNLNLIWTSPPAGWPGVSRFRPFFVFSISAASPFHAGGHFKPFGAFPLLPPFRLSRFIPNSRFPRFPRFPPISNFAQIDKSTIMAICVKSNLHQKH